MSKPYNGISIPLTSKRTDNFTPESLKPAEDGTGGEREVSFILRVPTPSERDQIGTRLYEVGLTNVTQEMIRATLIDELYKIDWSEDDSLPRADAVTADMAAAGAAVISAAKKGADPVETATAAWLAMNQVASEAVADNDLAADEIAGFLDGYWSRQQLDNELVRMWMEREDERVRDEAGGAPPIPSEPKPRTTISPRESSRAALIVNDVMERSPKMRSLAARQLDYGRANAQMMARLHILDIANHGNDDGELPFPKLEREPNGLITVDSIDALREYIGVQAWHELVERVDTHYNLGETERKNSDSPAGKPSDPTGLPEQSDESENSAGPSTASPTEPAPTVE